MRTDGLGDAGYNGLRSRRGSREDRWLIVGGRIEGRKG